MNFGEMSLLVMALLGGMAGLIKSMVLSRLDRIDHKLDELLLHHNTLLAALGAARFRFFAVPIKARGAASMPIRAFAEVA